MIYNLPEDLTIELGAIEKIDELRKQLKWRVAEPRQWYGGLRRLSFAKAVQASNSIEGYNASVDDVIAVVEDEETLDASDETRHALAGYRDAMTYVLQLAEEGDLEVSEALLKSLHFMMIKHDLSKRPGRWRLGSIYVRREETGEVVYEGPDIDQVPLLIGELLGCLAEHDAPVLLRAAMAHLNLVMVHPFRDGNGRMARCLQTLILARERIVAPVFSSIEEELGRNTQPYYEVLGKVGEGSWHPEHDARPWIRFCLNAHYQQAQRMLRRTTEIEHLWGQCELLASTKRLPHRAVGALCDASRGLRIHNWYYRIVVKESDGSEIDPSTASRDLRMLVDAGLLRPIGETRGRYYAATPELVQVRKEARLTLKQPQRADLFAPQAPQLNLMLAG
jgi:Fic family protein